jgi:hypothetical protein
MHTAATSIAHGQPAPLPAAFNFIAAANAGLGLPGDRAALGAAQRAFAQLKLSCMAALAHVCIERHPWLHREVYRSEEPLDLWVLRAPLLAALHGPQPEQRRQRQLLRRALEAVFGDDGGPETAYDSAFESALAPL